MSNLTSDQAAKLTSQVNDRIAEFGTGVLGNLSPGIVRLLHDVVMEWLETGDDAPRPWPAPDEEAALILDGYHAGFARGEETMRRKLSPAFVEDIPAPAPTVYTNGNGHAPDPEPSHSGNSRVNSPERDPADDEADDSTPDADVWKIGSAADPEPEPIPDVALALPTAMERTLSRPKPRTLAEVDAERARQAARSGPRKPLKMYRPTRDELIRELKRQAMAGVMPTGAAFDLAKPTNWASASAQAKRFNMSWTELALDAGLKPNLPVGSAT